MGKLVGELSRKASNRERERGKRMSEGIGFVCKGSAKVVLDA